VSLCLLGGQCAGARDDCSRRYANPSVEQYLMEAGPDAKLVKHGRLLIDGHSLNYGKTADGAE
jgi:hypothetical protein